MPLSLLVRHLRSGGLLYAVILGCANPVQTSPEMTAIAGRYLLESVNGGSLPFSLPPEQGCSRSIPLGTLELVTPSAEAGSIFSWDVGIRVGCVPVPPSISQEGKDFGSWDVSRDGVIRYVSDKGRGTYQGTHTPITGIDLFATVQTDGHTYTFRRVRSGDTPVGVLYMKFVDQANAPVSGVAIHVAFPNGENGGGTTPWNGEFGLQGVVGSWNIEVTSPTGYGIAPGESNPFSITVPRGVTELVVHLVKTGP